MDYKEKLGKLILDYGGLINALEAVESQINDMRIEYYYEDVNRKQKMYTWLSEILNIEKEVQKMKYFEYDKLIKIGG